MISRALLALSGLVLAGCAPEKTPAEDSARFTSATGVLEPEGSRWTVSAKGIGPLEFGMTAATMARVLNDSTLAGVDTRASCTHLHPKRVPLGASLMMSHGVFVRVDVDSAGVLTEAGIGVGDSEVSVLVINSGRARIESNKYSGPLAHNLIVTSAAYPENLMIFETDGRSILHYRAGTRAAAERVERCG
ncbi:MAG: hypothetical protein ABIT20_17530 [Gemmatimonadaceae bacterium]